MVYVKYGDGLVGPLAPGYHLISVPKLKGFADHYGLLQILPPHSFQPDLVLEFDETGPHVIPFEQYRAGRFFTLHASRSLESGPEIQARIKQLPHMNLNYNVLSNNCEHIARWLLTGKKSSGQIIKLIGAAAAIIVGLLVAAR